MFSALSPELPPKNPLYEAAENLFFTLSDPFKRDFNFRAYTGDFTLPISPDASALTSRYTNGRIRDITARTIRQNSPWEVSLGYDAAKDRLGLQELTVPLSSPNQDETLKLRYLQDDIFIAIHQRGKGKIEEVISANDRPSVFWSGAETTGLLADAGHRLPETCDNPVSMRLAVSQLHDRAIDWSRTDVKTVQQDGVHYLTLEREHTKETKIKRTKRGKISRHDLHKTHLKAVRVRQEPGADERSELEVLFNATDWTVHDVKVTDKIVERSPKLLEIITDENWRIRYQKCQRITPRLLRQLTHIYVDALGL